MDGGADPRQFGRQIVDALRHILMLRMKVPTPGAAPDEAMRLAAEAISNDLLLAAIRAFSQAAAERHAAWLPQLPLEMAFVELLERHTPPAESRATAAGEPGVENPNPRMQKTSAGGNPAPRQTKAGAKADPPGVNPHGQAAVREQIDPANQVEVESAAANSSEDKAVSDDSVRHRWKEVLEAAHRRDPLAQALLRSSKPMGLRAGAVVIGFPSDLLREKMEKGHNLAVVEGALEDIFGEKLGVRCVVQDRWSPAQSEEPVVPMADGGMVATATRDLGGQVVEVETIPENEEQQGQSEASEGESERPEGS